MPHATGGEQVQIDLIDVDAEVFTDSDELHAPNRWRQVITTLAVLGLTAGAAVVWWPTAKPPEWRVFHNAPVPAAGLTEELVFDQAPGPLATAKLAPAPTDIKPELGYVFGEPDGTMLTRRWAMFRTSFTNDVDAAPAPTDVPQVNGVTAAVHRVRVRRTVTWGPVAGRNWDVTTNMLDEADSLDFANHVGVVDGDPHSPTATNSQACNQLTASPRLIASNCSPICFAVTAVVVPRNQRC